MFSQFAKEINRFFIKWLVFELLTPHSAGIFSFSIFLGTQLAEVNIWQGRHRLALALYFPVLVEKILNCFSAQTTSVRSKPINSSKRSFTCGRWVDH